MQKEDTRKKIKIFGILFLIIALSQIVILIASYFSGDMSVSNVVKESGAAESIAKASIMIGIGIGAIFILIDVIMGVRALQQANGTYKGTVHISLAKFLLVLSIIAFAISLPEIFKNGTIDPKDFFSTLAYIIIYSYFIYYCKKNK